MKKCLSLAFILFISAAAAQNLNIVKIAKYQPLIYRDATGKYEGCGIRTTFLTSIPMPTHTGDFSVTIFKERDGRVTGITKMAFSFIPNINNFNKVKNLALTSYSMTNAKGKTIRLDDPKAGKEKNSQQAATSPIEAVNFINDITSGKPIQVGIRLQGEKNLNIFSIEGKDPLSQPEQSQIASCISQVFPSNTK